MRPVLFVGAGCMLLATATSGIPRAAAQDAVHSRSLAATCFTCHGTDGRSVGGVPPSLAGQNKAYLLQQLKEFKAGTRPASVMQQHAKGYTDEQLELIAGYFASRTAGPGTPAPAPSVSRTGY